MDIISLILVLAISIALGICLSYYMTVKLMCSSRGRSMMRDVGTAIMKTSMATCKEMFNSEEWKDMLKTGIDMDPGD